MSQIFIEGMMMALGLGMGLGVGSVMSIRNGLNNNPAHTLATMCGCNVIDVLMMFLYWIGVSSIFAIAEVKVVLTVVGVVILSKMGIGNIVNAKQAIKTEKQPSQNIFKSILDGIYSAILPSSLIWWVSTVGTVLVGVTAIPTYLMGCAGILTGFLMANIIYTVAVIIIKKFSSYKAIYYINILSGGILLYIAFTLIKSLVEG